MQKKIRKIGLEYKGKHIELNCKDCNIFQKILGLMFRKKKNASILLFEFSNDKHISFHSFFVLFPFIIIWLDKENNILEYREIFPWTPRIKIRKKFSKVIEIPVNKKNSKVLEELHTILRR